MNDLAFGTTLFASFFSLVAAIIIEGTSPHPAPDAVAAVARPKPAPVQLAQAGSVDCRKLAQAPVSAN
jgi:hypothetical protein